VALHGVALQADNPTEGWELIVFEEIHLTMLGEAFFRGYEARLYAAGCENLTYLSEDYWVPLSQKWVLIAQAAAPTSEYYCMCAADNYYQPNMLCESERTIKEGEWSVVTKGYFYDFMLNKLVLYNYHSMPLIGLQMTAATDRVREFPMDVRFRGIDTWMASQFGNKVNIIESEGWKHILCTNGMNNISNYRGQLIEAAEPPFNPTLTKMIDVVPGDICVRLWNLSRKIQELCQPSNFSKIEGTIPQQ
jgi:hypothetical protein